MVIKTERPHYHLIIYGLGLNIEDRTLIMDAWPYCDWSNSHIRNKSFGLVEPDSVRYVAQYIDKNLQEIKQMLSIPKKAVSLVFDALVWVLEKVGVIKTENK